MKKNGIITEVILSGNFRSYDIKDVFKEVNPEKDNANLKTIKLDNGWTLRQRTDCGDSGYIWISGSHDKKPFELGLDLYRVLRRRSYKK